jgi:hypothetical protein
VRAPLTACMDHHLSSCWRPPVLVALQRQPMLPQRALVPADGPSSMLQPCLRAMLSADSDGLWLGCGHGNSCCNVLLKLALASDSMLRTATASTPLRVVCLQTAGVAQSRVSNRSSPTSFSRPPTPILPRTARRTSDVKQEGRQGQVAACLGQHRVWAHLLAEWRAQVAGHPHLAQWVRSLPSSTCEEGRLCERRPAQGQHTQRHPDLCWARRRAKDPPAGCCHARRTATLLCGPRVGGCAGCDQRRGMLDDAPLARAMLEDATRGSVHARKP